MMKKKLFAFLTALCMLTSASAVVSAEETAAIPVTEFVVIGANEGSGFVIKSINRSETYYFTCTAEDKNLSYGDIVEIEGYWIATEMVGTNTIRFYSDEYCEAAIPAENITITGSVYDAGTEADYKVSKIDNCYASLTNEEEKVSYYTIDFLNSNYMQRNGIDWYSGKNGDEVTMLTYKGVPCIPVGISPLGDVNSDSTLNVLDVIIMNKHLLTGSDLPALANAAGGAKLAKSGEPDLGQCDFNGNGVIDPDDSLCMLKRIIGLETIGME